MSNEVNTDELAQQLGQLNVMQLVALTKKLEADWGVSATPQQSAQTNNNQQQQQNQETAQSEFTVVLASYPPDKKMGLVKLVREVLGMALLESKNLVESVPKTIKEGLSKEEADALKAKFAEAGGVVEVK